MNDAVRMFLQSVNRLLILGFNAALTEVPGRGRGDRIKEMELKLHPELKEPLTLLCGDPNTTIMILSGSGRDVLDNNFGEYDMWLAAENGMFLRSTKGRWMTTMPEHLNLEWFDCVKQVFEYFTERTPRSLFEQRETSLQWNYRYADVEFGLLQSKDMLQHLVTGPISNTSVDVVQGSRSVEAQTLGVTKGAAIDRILGEVHCTKSFRTPIDYVLCLGHFLAKDEDIYTYFEPEVPPESGTTSKDTTPKRASRRSNIKSQGKSHPPGLSTDEKSPRRTSRGSEQASRSLLDVKDEKFFSCAVGRTCTRARYLLNSSDDVVTFIKELAAALAPNSSD